MFFKCYNERICFKYGDDFWKSEVPGMRFCIHLDNHYNLYKYRFKSRHQERKRLPEHDESVQAFIKVSGERSGVY